LLSEFRFKDGSPPELPAVNILNVSSQFKRRFSWAALFATAAAAAILGMIWFATSTGDASVQIANTAAPTIPVSTVSEKRTEATNSYEPPVQKASLPSLQKPRFVKTIFRTRRDMRDPQPTVAKTENLTRDERYAYDRLMLALAIAGSKLKVVQDTIDRKSDLDQRSNRNEK
jgi:hypothetical protein